MTIFHNNLLMKNITFLNIYLNVLQEIIYKNFKHFFENEY
jgi:hypothetical protein